MITQWREEGQNGGVPGRHFCVFNDGVWYLYQPPKCTPWLIYLSVVKRHMKPLRDALKAMNDAFRGNYTSQVIPVLPPWPR